MKGGVTTALRKSGEEIRWSTTCARACRAEVGGAGAAAAGDATRPQIARGALPDGRQAAAGTGGGPCGGRAGSSSSR
jgi:hypothetical protein